MPGAQLSTKCFIRACYSLKEGANEQQFFTLPMSMCSFGMFIFVILQITSTQIYPADQCSFGPYIITSNDQTVTVPVNATLCFTCKLPSLSFADEWSVDEYQLQEMGPFNGSVIITDSSSLFNSSNNIKLKCRNKNSGESWTVHVYKNGKA